jgi:hypothetical protein
MLVLAADDRSVSFTAAAWLQNGIAAADATSAR